MTPQRRSKKQFQCKAFQFLKKGIGKGSGKTAMNKWGNCVGQRARREKLLIIASEGINTLNSSIIIWSAKTKKPNKSNFFAENDSLSSWKKTRSHNKIINAKDASWIFSHLELFVSFQYANNYKDKTSSDVTTGEWWNKFLQSWQTRFTNIDRPTAAAGFTLFYDSMPPTTIMHPS